jgi:hypothetical protein
VLTTQQLLQQLQLQDELNQQVHPEWIKQGWSWPTATMMEAAELFDHLGWKWWKASPEPDQQQIRLELVDIWHFVLSSCLEGHHGDYVFAAADLHRTLRSAEIAPSNSGDFRILLRRFISDAATGKINLLILVPMMHKYGLFGSVLHELYIQKGVLNLFRQRNGYKEGTYVKIWDGAEDNVT